MENVIDKRLQSASRLLPESFRMAVLLCDVEGHSYEEIATLMNSSLGTVRSRIHRGRALLRRAMENQRRSRRNPQTLCESNPERVATATDKCRVRCAHCTTLY